MPRSFRRNRSVPATLPSHRLRLWPDGILPEGEAGSASNIEDLAQADLDVYEPRLQRQTQLDCSTSTSGCPAYGTAIIIVPGGAYNPPNHEWAKVHEGAEVATWLVSLGVLSVVLKYRLPRGRPLVPLSDALRAIETVRGARNGSGAAAPWAFKVRRVGVMGFSAGGHLAALAATAFTSSVNRPDFSLLMYPVTTLRPPLGHQMTRRNFLGPQPGAELVDRFSPDRRLTSHAPPAFVAHARDDNIVPHDNAALFCNTSRARGVACEQLLLERGGHAFVVRHGPWRTCTTAAAAWLVRTVGARRKPSRVTAVR